MSDGGGDVTCGEECCPLLCHPPALPRCRAGSGWGLEPCSGPVRAWRWGRGWACAAIVESSDEESYSSTNTNTGQHARVSARCITHKSGERKGGSGFGKANGFPVTLNSTMCTV